MLKEAEGQCLPLSGQVTINKYKSDICGLVGRSASALWPSSLAISLRGISSKHRAVKDKRVPSFCVAVLLFYSVLWGVTLPDLIIITRANPRDTLICCTRFEAIRSRKVSLCCWNNPQILSIKFSMSTTRLSSRSVWLVSILTLRRSTQE